MIKNYFTFIAMFLSFLLVSAQNQKSIDSCKVIIAKSKNDTIKLETMAHLSMIENQGRANYPATELAMRILANEIISKTKNIDIALTAKSYLAQANLNISNYYIQKGDYTNALFYSKAGLKVAIEINDPNDMSNGYNTTGVIYYETGQNSKAIEYMFKSLKIDEQQGNIEYVASSYNNIGAIYHSSKQFKEAKKCFFNALKYENKLEDKTIIASTYNNISAIYDAEKKPIESIKYANKALEIAKKNNNKSLIATFKINLGKTYNTGLNQLEIAKKYFNEGLSIALENDYKPQQFSAYTNLGNLYNKLNDFETAKIYSLKAYKIGKINNDNKGLLFTTKNLSDSYLKLKYFKNAYAMINEYSILKDSVEGETAKKVNLKNELKYTYEKKSIKDSISNANQKIIASAKLSKEKNQKLAFGSFALLALAGVGFTYFLYRQKRKSNTQLTEINDKINRQNNTLKTLNTELITSEENLQKSNNSKEQLISMMSHDLLNPITAITNYNQQIISRKNNSDELLEAFKTVDAAIQPMHGLLDNMLHWTAIQKDGISAKLKKQDVNEIVKEIIGIYRPQAQLKFIKLKDDLDNDFVLESDKSILSLILRNLINNAIKYSGNETEIEISSNSETKSITIKDQGFGMTDEMIGYLNAKRLDKIESKGTGLGLKLCYEFAEAIGARIVFEKNEVGTSVNLKL